LLRHQAASGNGHLERSRFLWHRARTPRDGGAVTTYLVEHEGRAEGYFSIGKVESAHLHGYNLRLTDLVVRSSRAGHKVIDFLAHHRSMADEVQWFGSPTEPIHHLLREPWHSVELLLNWMLRVVRVKEAFESRGYASGVSAEAHVAITDEVLPDNSGPWILRVDRGRPTATRGGQGKLKLTVRGLAALYASHLSPFDAQAVGLAEGPEEDLGALGAMFAGPMPWMSDMF
jgi:predicted acetyltransferase